MTRKEISEINILKWYPEKFQKYYLVLAKDEFIGETMVRINYVKEIVKIAEGKIELILNKSTITNVTDVKVIKEFIGKKGLRNAYNINFTATGNY